MKAVIEALEALGAARRAAGMPCNPRREPLTSADYLSEDEIQQLYALTLRVALDERLAAVCWEPR